MPGPLVSNANAHLPGAEFDRRDAALSHRPIEAVTALDAWPTRHQPDLSRSRRLYLPRDAQSVLYFEQERSIRSWTGRTSAPQYNRYQRGGQY